MNFVIESTYPVVFVFFFVFLVCVCMCSVPNYLCNYRINSECYSSDVFEFLLASLAT